MALPSNIDLHPDTVSNAEMGSVFEELIRKFAEQYNETAGAPAQCRVRTKTKTVALGEH